jgi:hypothetical protein
VNRSRIRAVFAAVITAAVLLLIPAPAQAQWSYVDHEPSCADNTACDGATATMNTASLTAAVNNKVVVLCTARIVSPNPSLTSLGGLTDWESIPVSTHATITSMSFYGFETTVDADGMSGNIVVTDAAGTATSDIVCVAVVMAPTVVAAEPVDDFGANVDNDDAAALSFTHAAQVTTNPQALVMAWWSTGDDNAWGSLSGTSGTWAYLGPTGTANQFRNTGTSDASISIAWKTQAAAGDTGTVSNTETANGPDAAVHGMIAFAEGTVAASGSPRRRRPLQ